MAHSKEKQPQSEPEVIEGTAEDAQEINAVVVTRVVSEDGTISADTQPLGDVKLTEIQTILELGIQSFRAKAGLK